MKSARGFSILEILVVIAIMAVLASIVLVTLDTARAKTRDTERITNVQEVSKALNLYIVNNNTFPVFPEEITLTGDDAFSITLEDEEIISAVPKDPTHPARTYTYQSDASGSTYTLSFCLETDTIPNYSEGCSNTMTP
jgi:prepilin-type N-terminal cleavage/methylation domain-containing protein|tara:strand:+ start:8369 stop:8782 length:414 start_codon:yes stop_codon:yes gene_type:complete